ncbi:MAG: hypothetical protein QOI05_2275 [Bradyrhizobium sp.]|jgi:hypothetical protein|nr:hypothetical protein [Bradyrhizobium sp.]
MSNAQSKKPHATKLHLTKAYGAEQSSKVSKPVFRRGRTAVKEPGYGVTKTAAYAAINENAYEPDARAQALLEGVRIAQEDLRKAGGTYDLAQVRTLMQGVSRQAVDKRVQEGSLLAVPGPSNRRSYPTLQFNPDGTIVEGLKAVCAALPTSNPWTILNFLAHPDDRLQGRKPIDVLKAGNVELVVEAARRLGQQGA